VAPEFIRVANACEVSSKIDQNKKKAYIKKLISINKLNFERLIDSEQLKITNEIDDIIRRMK